MGDWWRRLVAPSNPVVRESWLTILGSQGALGHVFFNSWPVTKLISPGFKSQATLANLADIGRSHMGEAERGEHMPTLAIVFKIARGPGCPAAEVMGRAEEVFEVRAAG